MFYSTVVSGTVISTRHTYKCTSAHTDLHTNSFSLAINMSQCLWIKRWRLQVFLVVLGNARWRLCRWGLRERRKGPGSCYHLSERRGAPVPHDQPVLAPDKSQGDSWGGRASVSTFPNAHIHPYPQTKNSTAEGHIPHPPQC